MSKHTQLRKNSYKELVKVLDWLKSDRPLSYSASEIEQLKHRWNNECIFRYEGKQGIHYVFRETRGGWTRTYTDAQLIGKVIQEVKL